MLTITTNLRKLLDEHSESVAADEVLSLLDSDETTHEELLTSVVAFITDIQDGENIRLDPLSYANDNVIDESDDEDDDYDDEEDIDVDFDDDEDD